MKLLTLDTAPTSVGWAAGETSARPTFGTKTFPSCGKKCGRLSRAYGDWLYDKIMSVEPDLVLYEQPLLFPGARMKPIDHFKTLGMGWKTEDVCEAVRVDCDWVPVATLKKHFTGNGRAGKPEMVNAARQLGYRVRNGDEADAIAVFSYGVSINDVDHAHQWLPLEASL